MSWANSNHLIFSGVGLDLEVDIHTLEEFQKHEWWLLLESILSRNSEKLKQAKKDLHKLVDMIKQDGLYVQTYILPFIIDERKEHSTLLQVLEVSSQFPKTSASIFRQIMSIDLLQRMTGIVDVPEVDVEAPMLYTTMFPDGLGFLDSYAVDLTAIGEQKRTEFDINICQQL